MNRTLLLGIAIFVAVLGIALAGGEKQAVAGHGCGGCWGCGGCGGCGGLFAHRHRCHGCYGCHGGLLARLRARRCHGCYGCHGCCAPADCCAPAACCAPVECNPCDCCGTVVHEEEAHDDAPIMAPAPESEAPPAASLRGTYSFRQVAFRR